MTQRRADYKVGLPIVFIHSGPEDVRTGLIPWQAGIATRLGRLQFMLGSEVGVSFYHNGNDHPPIIPTPGVPPLNATLVILKSVEIEFPILEYRLFRSLSLNQSSGLMIQPDVGFRQTGQFLGRIAHWSFEPAPTHHHHDRRTGSLRLALPTYFRMLNDRSGMMESSVACGETRGKVGFPWSICCPRFSSVVYFFSVPYTILHHFFPSSNVSMIICSGHTHSGSIDAHTPAVPDGQRLFVARSSCFESSRIRTSAKCVIERKMPGSPTGVPRESRDSI